MLDSPAILGSLDDIGVRAIVSKSDAVSHLVPAIHAAHTGASTTPQRLLLCWKHVRRSEPAHRHRLN